MSMTFGFVILSHADPDQLLRLCRALATLYDDPPIACHHDFSQSDLDARRFPACVSFVLPSLETSWGHWSVIEATLAATDLLYRIGDPDYFFVLSAADYPMALPDAVGADLKASGADALIDGFPILQVLHGETFEHETALANFRTPENAELGRHRYIKAGLKLPRLRRRASGGWRLGAHTVPLPFNARFPGRGSSFRLFFGSQWFTASRKVAQRILNPTDLERRLQRHFRGRFIPEESYFQSIVFNDTGLTTDHRARRYVDWKDRGAHPAWLSVADLDNARASGAHFARKFRPADPALDAIDAELGISRM